ncbi:nitrogenase component 1 [Sodalinema gerasimenkoae]|uniref:nitrogenase component 1 n=1 Tax=Sodalinema gerasimenkoae TaxID=2862348 RepID=UPI001359D138|nr:nitrogenase component 1 [Sodalinema gerasimenkoae]
MKHTAKLKTGHPYISTTNACKLCKPLGACIAFRGIEGTMPFLHGSQGCATYMRRYIISHFREPIDIASSSLSEKHAVYGGGSNLKLGLNNSIGKYAPNAVGVATTCLTETIGDDVSMLLREWRVDADAECPNPEIPVVNVSTASYSGTHMEGFHAVVRETIAQVALTDVPIPESADEDIKIGTKPLNLMPGFVSTADLRHLRDICEDFGLEPTILPDYSDTLDAPVMAEYEKLTSGGTSLQSIRHMPQAIASIEFGRVLSACGDTGGELLQEKADVPLYAMGMPIGVRESDRFFNTLSRVSHRPIPRRHDLERGRLLDAYADGHKYLFGKRAIVYGEEDLVVGLTAFLSEIGVQPVLCASGGSSGYLKDAIAAVTDGLLREAPQVRDDVDFFDIAQDALTLKPDFLIGNSKGYSFAREQGIPLIRVGFPIHDRMGGQRILHLGYRGSQNLFDLTVNAIIAKKQRDSPVGYGYI